jgi:signal transduction histidine kinase
MPVREQEPHDPAAAVRQLAEEFRQPLGTIESIAHYLGMVLPRGQTSARRQLGRLQDEVRQMHWILAETLYFSQAAPLNLQRLDLTEAVSRDLAESSPAEGTGLSFDLEANLPPVWLDLAQVQHLLRGIVAFFRRVSVPGGLIVVRTCGAKDEVALEIASEMLEYSAEDIQPLFEPFGSHFPPGLALGLASARRIAEAHGGRVQAISAPPHSLTLSIAFPAA